MPQKKAAKARGRKKISVPKDALLQAGLRTQESFIDTQRRLDEESTIAHVNALNLAAEYRQVLRKHALHDIRVDCGLLRTHYADTRRHNNDKITRLEAEFDESLQNIVDLVQHHRSTIDAMTGKEYEYLRDNEVKSAAQRLQIIQQFHQQIRQLESSCDTQKLEQMKISVTKQHAAAHKDIIDFSEELALRRFEQTKSNKITQDKLAYDLSIVSEPLSNQCAELAEKLKEDTSELQHKYTQLSASMERNQRLMKRMNTGIRNGIGKKGITSLPNVQPNIAIEQLHNMEQVLTAERLEDEHKQLRKVYCNTETYWRDKLRHISYKFDEVLKNLNQKISIGNDLVHAVARSKELLSEHAEFTRIQSRAPHLTDFLATLERLDAESTDVANQLRAALLIK